MSGSEYDRHDATPVGLRPVTDLSKWVWLAPAALLLIAILPLPYGFYMGMRWVVSCAAGYLAWKEYVLNRRTANSYTWIFGTIALVFNPIIPLHLFKLLWIVVNIVAAMAFVGHYRLRLQHA